MSVCRKVDDGKELELLGGGVKRGGRSFGDGDVRHGVFCPPVLRVGVVAGPLDHSLLSALRLFPCPLLSVPLLVHVQFADNSEFLAISAVLQRNNTNERRTKDVVDRCPWSTYSFGAATFAEIMLARQRLRDVGDDGWSLWDGQ